ncbi:Histone-lysine N-methyltransferase set-6 [Madurella fahalii]|uniref:Histone-lysine N-methyltransferase set-6 n=1 Tax=Madurella fahalii TaxID=1157608 RepID=A0ABQ0GL26_9PEZI
MATKQPTDVADGKAGDWYNDLTASSREAFHTDPELCESMLRKVVSTFPLKIRSSQISMGSGLFTEAQIDAGREIYQSPPLMTAVDVGNESFCHYCLKDTKDGFSTGSAGDDNTSLAKSCTGCRVARFCSKECQKAAWTEFHKDECRVMRDVPQMKAQHLLAHRLVFWGQRKRIMASQGKAISFLETHFREYSEDGDRISEITDIAMAIREATGGKVNLGLVWRTVPALRVNSVRIRPAARKESVGYALDLVTAVMNHSCDPNAFAFFDGRQLYVRSLKTIAAGEEITICYLDPTIAISIRREFLQREYFFDCRCKRCESELNEQSALLGHDASLLPTLYQSQQDILDLMRNAVLAARRPGLYPEFENLPSVEGQLRAITQRAFPSTTTSSTTTTPSTSTHTKKADAWPAHMAPLPAARLALAMLYLEQGKPVQAARHALRGARLGRRDPRTPSGPSPSAWSGCRPEWVNDTMDVVAALLFAASAGGGGGGAGLPAPDDLRTVAYGYLYEACRAAGDVFGGGARYTRDTCGLFAAIVGGKHGSRPGSEEFKGEFEQAQRRVGTWAGIGEKDWVRLSY